MTRAFRPVFALLAVAALAAAVSAAAPGVSQVARRSQSPTPTIVASDATDAPTTIDPDARRSQ